MAGRILRRLLSGVEAVVYGPPSVVSGWFHDDPGYAGSLVAFLGLGLATANVLTIVIFVAVSSFVFVRTIGVEERALSTALGQAYDDYREERARLMPGVW